MLQNSKDIRIENFDYPLPEERIAKYPLEKRDECRLLLRSPQGKIYHRRFKELPDLLPAGALLLCNDTKVIRARLTFHKETGAAIEIFLLEPISPTDYVLNFQSTDHCVWKCLVGNLKKWKEGELHITVTTDADKEITLYAQRKESLPDGSIAIEFRWEGGKATFSELIEKAGMIPIPPYLNRESEESDLKDYQTVYARQQGSVAAPTAGLHFTPAVFEGLEAHGVKIEKLTLHVGAGTFRPVKSDTIGDHAMHGERFSVTLAMLETLYKYKKEGRPVVAVGTTSVRTLESLPYIAESLRRGEENPLNLGQWRAYTEEYRDFDTLESLEYLIERMKKEEEETLSAETSIMIAPGFRWRITDAMVTNFHQPKSTLLLLVSSFLGKDGDFESWRKVYDAALEGDYRFLSYGDACLLMSQEKEG